MSKQTFAQEIVGRQCMATQDSNDREGQHGTVVGAYIVKERLTDSTATYPVFIVELDSGRLMDPVYNWGVRLLPEEQPG